MSRVQLPSLAPIFFCPVPGLFALYRAACETTGRGRMARDAVLFANEAFYRAFADRDIAAGEEIGAGGARSACIHPGGSPVIGRERVRASGRAILANPASPAISC